MKKSKSKAKGRINDVNYKQIDQETINFYRVQGAATTFIAFLNESKSYDEIFEMWRWLGVYFDENEIDERMIFPCFKNVSERGYDIKSLSSKLIDALMTVDWDEVEVDWLQNQFAIMTNQDSILEESAVKFDLANDSVRERVVLNFVLKNDNNLSIRVSTPEEHEDFMDCVNLIVQKMHNQPNVYSKIALLNYITDGMIRKYHNMDENEGDEN